MSPSTVYYDAVKFYQHINTQVYLMGFDTIWFYLNLSQTD